MSVNSSFTYNNVLGDQCSTVRFYIKIGFTSLRITVILPLCTLVICLAHQRLRQQRSFKTASHANIITYHMVVMELMWVLGGFSYLYGTYTNHSLMIMIGVCVHSITFYAEIILHILTCVERYLAVVHPITFLSLRTARGVKMRNSCIGCVWMLSLGLTLMVLSIIIISFCSLSVLYALIHSGSGERVREKQLVNQKKQRAFYTITAILGTFWLWFEGLLVNITVNQHPELNRTIKCVVDMSVSWFNLPSHLILPLLYLHRAGKLRCCFYKNK